MKSRLADRNASPGSRAPRRDHFRAFREFRGRLKSLRVSGALLTIPAISPALATAAATQRGAEQLYTEFCASCHGANLEGGLGVALRGNQGMLEATDAALATRILEGSPSGSMPAFAAAISTAEAHALVAFLREQQTARNIPERSQTLPTAPQSSEHHRYRIETLLTDLDVPWSLAFLPDGSLLYTERRGQLFVVPDAGTGTPVEITGLPAVWVRDEAGLMSVAVPPDHAKTGWIYLSFSDPGPNETSMTRIVRGRIREQRWTDEEPIFATSPESYTGTSRSYGGRLVFVGQHLFFSVGDRWEAAQAQDLNSPLGKIHRIYPDGHIPPDNPFANQPGVLGSIWSYGHRNPQGLAHSIADGSLWATEHGPRGGDELNHIEPGANYGWPLATHGLNYDGTPAAPASHAPGTRQPVKHWTPSIATSPLHFYAGDAFPRWKNNLFLGSLAQQQLWRFETNDGRIVAEELIWEKLGRIRDIRTGPDGKLYLALELPGEPGFIVRLVPET